MYIRSFVKWPGQKTRLLHKLLPHLQEGDRLVDCFNGSGVVFANTDYDEYLLSDLDSDLMNAFRFLKTKPNKFIPLVELLFTEKGANTPEKYYSNREDYNYSEDKEYRAALLIYLTRHSFNSLVRRNKSKGHI